MKVRKCKGSRDLSPQEMSRFRFIEETFRNCCLKRGYEEVRTPTLEYLHLFTSTGTLTPGLLGKVYSFLDWDGWSGERVVLRPDGTIPIARLYIENMEDRKLAKLFYVSSVFIFEETGKENREKWQCGVELIGGHSPLADAELIMLASEVLRKLGLQNIVLKLSHAGLIRSLLIALGLGPEEQNRVFDRILDGDIKALAGIESGSPELNRVLSMLLDLKGKSSGFLKNLKVLFSRHLPELEPALKDFVNIVELLESLGIKCQIDLASGRGFEYYTGVMYQLFAGREKIGGGGRYDALIPLMGGRDIPASGFALYLDRLMKIAGRETPADSSAPGILIIIETGETKATKEGFSLASSLHEAGYMAELDMGGQEPANLKWKINVRSAAPAFVVTDTVRGKTFEVRTVGEVLALLNR